MKVHQIRRQTVEAFALHHVQSRKAFQEWLEKIKYAEWQVPADIVSTFPAADLLGNGTSRVVFDIGGNKYRAIAKYAFGAREVHLFLCWMGTHAGYDKLCKNGEQFTVSNY